MVVERGRLARAPLDGGPDVDGGAVRDDDAHVAEARRGAAEAEDDADEDGLEERRGHGGDDDDGDGEEVLGLEHVSPPERGEHVGLDVVPPEVQEQRAVDEAGHVSQEPEAREPSYEAEEGHEAPDAAL